MKRATKVVAVLFFLLININFVEAQEFSALEVIKKADQKIQEIASKISPLAKENSFEFKLK